MGGERRTRGGGGGEIMGGREGLEGAVEVR